MLTIRSLWKTIRFIIDSDYSGIEAFSENQGGILGGSKSRISFFISEDTLSQYFLIVVLQSKENVCVGKRAHIFYAACCLI